MRRVGLKMSNTINKHNNAEDMCRTYITKYCEQYKISPEEAKKHNIVQAVLYWVNKEYDKEKTGKESIFKTIPGN